LLFAGCGLNEPAREPHLRPADAPDFVVIGVSGHSIEPINYNPEYLGAQGTLDVYRDVILSSGHSVRTGRFADNLETYVFTETGEVAAYGFLDLLETLRNINAEWIADFDNPTRIIVVAHSHGTVWAHTALHVLEQEGTPMPVEFLVDIDAVSTGWETHYLGVGDEWGTEIPAYSAAHGLTWPFAIENAEDSWPIPGRTWLQDVEDVVPTSVATNLEIWSNDFTFIHDSESNHRLDGSTSNIFFSMSGVNHESTDEPYSDAVLWSSNFIRARLQSGI
jgi:hypothetical protein